jgi:hypothetical protein
MPRDSQPHVGRPFNDPVSTGQMSRLFKTEGHVRSISVQTPPMTIANTIGGGIHIGMMQEFLARSASQKQVETMKLGHIVTLIPASPEMVIFQPLKQTVEEFPDDVRRVTWAQSGDVRVAIVPANFSGSDFAKLTSVGFESKTPTMRIDKLGSDWVVTWIPRWAMREVPDGASIVRCT